MSLAQGRSRDVDGGPAARALLTALVAAGGLVSFASLRPSQPWLLFFTAAVVGLAAAGTARGHPRMAGRSDAASLGFALLPVVCVLAAGAFADRVLEGYLRVAGAGAGAAIAGVAVFAEYHAADPDSRGYSAVRVVLAVASYAAAFAIFSVMFEDRIDLVPSAAAIGVAGWLLAASLLREGMTVDSSALFAGFAVGVSVSELRTVLYFFPVEGVLGGAVLLVGFHVATGIVHHLLARDFSVITVAEYGLVAGTGIAAVIAASSLA